LSGEYVSDDENVNRFLNYLGYLNPEPWRIGIGEVLKKKGGTIRLIIPSRKGFGRNGSGSIPSNASLDCTLKLYDVNNQIEFEDIFVKKYIQQNNITGLTRLNTGVYYQIISPGTGDPVELTSTISAAYTGKLTNGTVFDSATASSPLKTTLNGVILGWQEILPLIKKGGKIRAIIPPARAYGSSARGDIPPNSILDFEIELVDVTN
jgi:FKBP-type peptidyl-prolyl cis-trans isomerase